MLPDWLAAILDRPLLSATILLLVALGMAILLGQLAARRRRHDLLAAIGVSVRGDMKLLPARQWGTVACTLQPAPEPYALLSVYFTMRPRPWPLGMLSWLFGGRSQRIELRGTLRQRPRSELAWRRGHTPARPAGRTARTALWTLQTFPASQGQFAVRGDHAHTLGHIFGEIAARYGGFLQACTVQADKTPHVQISLVANGLNAEDIPALVATMSTLGRVAGR